MRGEGGVTLAIMVGGLAPGSYGAHIHAVGRCEGPAFTSAGPHWNPAMRQHGRLNPQGTHAGDLPNLVVAADGSGSLTAPVTAPLDGEGGLFDADGAAVVVHAMADDERTDPTGNSGARILCAVLQPAAPTVR
jgi:Cu-Zn family superoxide dismutase